MPIKFLVAAILLSISSITCSRAQADTRDRIDLSTDNEACTPQNLSSIAHSIKRQAKDNRPDEAWLLINSLLCKTSRQAEDSIRQHMTTHTRFFENGKSKRVKHPGEIMAKGIAYYVWVRDGDAHQLTIGGDGADGRSIEYHLIFVSGKWVVARYIERID